MVIEGKIVEVMETWPLQMFVQADKDVWHIALTASTLVIERGRPVGPEQLLPGLDVRAEGDASGPRGMQTTRIDIG